MSLLAKSILHAYACLYAKTAYMLFVPSKEKIIKRNGLEFVLHFFDTNIYTQHHPIEDHSKEGTKDPLLPPYPLHRQVKHLQNGAAHYAFINLYMVEKGHVVISSEAPKARQGDPLEMCDFHALSQCIQGYGRKGVAYYNSGVDSGCSQMHKHMQFAPLPRSPLMEAMIDHYPLPYKYYVTKLENDEPIGIKNAYNRLMKESSYNGSYNFVVIDGHAAIVPRIRGTHKCGININSLGVAGHFFIWDKDEEMVSKDPLKIISDLCIPKL